MKEKSMGTAWVMWFLGLHFAYLGKWKLQVIYWLTLYGVLVWWVIEATKLKERVEEHNAAVSSSPPVASEPAA